jgi:hypothetical protein
VITDMQGPSHLSHSWDGGIRCRAWGSVQVTACSAGRCLPMQCSPLFTHAPYATGLLQIDLSHARATVEADKKLILDWIANNQDLPQYWSHILGGSPSRIK